MRAEKLRCWRPAGRLPAQPFGLRLAEDFSAIFSHVSEVFEVLGRGAEGERRTLRSDPLISSRTFRGTWLGAATIFMCVQLPRHGAS